ncbi:hypothetical protein SAMN02927924_01345 [Sphingobium faniae]|nr:hypothetical protein SAMN02927924_01345 [Sphingobium faniae]
MGDDSYFISADRPHTKVKSFATVSRPKSTIVKVEFEVSNSWALNDLLRQLHAAKNPGQDEII